MSAVVKQKTGTQVARPLTILVPLIKKDLEQANDAAQRAGLPYYRAAGEKMLEAKPQMKHGEFRPWLKRNFGISDTQATRYMHFAETGSDENVRARTYSSLRDFSRQELGERGTGKTTWHEPVKESIERAKRDAVRLRGEQLSRAQERDEMRKLGLRMIDIGFKVLSKELHPDRGGTREAMARLNREREILKASA